MGDYLKLFELDSERVNYEGGGSYIEPYVSYVEEDNTVHYNKVETRLVATYNVEDTSNPTPLFVGVESMGFPASAIYDKIEIDNVEIDMSDLSSSEQGSMTVYSYGFASDGQHTVKYTLKDPAFIGAEVNEQTQTITRLGATFMCCPIASVEIPNSVTSIGGVTFHGCNNLTSVTIPASVTSIGEHAFDNCGGLTNVTINNGVTSIGKGVFSDCKSLLNVTMGNTVTNIGDFVFNGCRSLTSVTVEATTPPTLGEGVFNTNASGRKIYVPNESVDAYKAATNWSTYAADIQAIPTE